MPQASFPIVRNISTEPLLPIQDYVVELSMDDLENVSGGEPITLTALAVGFVVGVAAGVVSNIIYNEFIKDDTAVVPCNCNCKAA